MHVHHTVYCQPGWQYSVTLSPNIVNSTALKACQIWSTGLTIFSDGIWSSHMYVLCTKCGQPGWQYSVIRYRISSTGLTIYGVVNVPVSWQYAVGRTCMWVDDIRYSVPPNIVNRVDNIRYGEHACELTIFGTLFVARVAAVRPKNQLGGKSGMLWVYLESAGDLKRQWTR